MVGSGCISYAQPFDDVDRTVDLREQGQDTPALNMVFWA
jgi:hypothetical protein